MTTWLFFEVEKLAQGNESGLVSGAVPTLSRKANGFAEAMMVMTSTCPKLDTPVVELPKGGLDVAKVLMKVRSASCAQPEGGNGRKGRAGWDRVVQFSAASTRFFAARSSKLGQSPTLREYMSGEKFGA